MNPITTIIQNNTSNGRFVNWTGETKTWLQPNGIVEVPFEVWSVCDKKQRNALIADLQYGTVVLSLRILKPNGNYETVPYNPIAGIVNQEVRHLAPHPGPSESLTEEVATSNKHIVIAGSKGMNSVAQQFGLKSEEVVRPGVSEVGADISDTVEFKNGAMEAHDEVQYTPPPAPAPAPVKLEDVAMEKQAEEEVPAADEGKPLDEVINELLSAKNYEEAYELLVEEFGAEKITFKATALKQLKTFAAIVKKYKLDA